MLRSHLRLKVAPRPEGKLLERSGQGRFASFSSEVGQAVRAMNAKLVAAGIEPM